MKSNCFAIFLVFLFLFKGLCLNAQDTDSISQNSDNLSQILNQHFEGQWFLAYQYKDLKDEEISQFTLKRSYLTLKHTFNERYSVRFTQDITLDEEGSDAGNVEMRLKYCYLNMKLDNFMIFHKPSVEIGLVHRPWLDFEQSINPYRIQGKMFLERVGLLNSADFGFTFMGLLGGEMDDKYQEHVNTDFPGKYGSISLGVYNGSGYHDLENNKNKTFESRITLRPFHAALPGLQFSYFMLYGKGNIESEPDFTIHNLFVSYENKYFTLTNQWYTGKGNSAGTFIGPDLNAYDNEGFSLFGEYKFPKYRWTAFARYDFFETEQTEAIDNQRIIAGIGYYFYKKSKFVLDLEYMDSGMDHSWRHYFYEAAIEINF